MSNKTINNKFHITGAFGVEKILEYNNAGININWNFPYWFPFKKLFPNASFSLIDLNAIDKKTVLIVINLNDKLWKNIQSILSFYNKTILVQTEGVISWEPAYENCQKFDVFLTFDQNYSWHPGFIQFSLPYDSKMASSHLDRRTVKQIFQTSKTSTLSNLLCKFLPRKNKAVLISSLHTSSQYKIRYDIAQLFINKIEVYGGGWPINMLNYKGKCISKIETLKRYKYAFVFENQKQSGYITEKILDCFVADTIPIYWGTDNVFEYIPQNMLLRLDDFLQHKEFPTQNEYKTLLQNIQHQKNYVFEKFSVEKFFKKLEEAITIESSRNREK